MRSNGIVYSVSGAKDGVPLIFAHGFPFNRGMWARQIAGLQHAALCITYDVRGLGESLPGDGQFTMEMFVDDLLAVAEAAGAARPVVCGLSMGGYIALRAIEREPERFGGVVLMDTKSSADADEVKLRRAGHLAMINREGVPAYVDATVHGLFHPESKERMGQAYHELVAGWKQNSPAGVKGCLLAMAARTDTTASLAACKLPSLLLCGEADTLTPPAVMLAMAGAMPHAEFHTIAGAGHLAPIEQPDAVNALLLHYLRRVYPRA